MKPCNQSKCYSIFKGGERREGHEVFKLCNETLVLGLLSENILLSGSWCTRCTIWGERPRVIPIKKNPSYTCTLALFVYFVFLSAFSIFAYLLSLSLPLTLSLSHSPYLFIPLTLSPSPLSLSLSLYSLTDPLFVSLSLCLSS